MGGYYIPHWVPIEIDDVGIRTKEFSYNRYLFYHHIIVSLDTLQDCRTFLNGLNKSDANRVYTVPCISVLLGTYEVSDFCIGYLKFLN